MVTAIAAGGGLLLLVVLALLARNPRERPQQVESPPRIAPFAGQQFTQKEAPPNPDEVRDGGATTGEVSIPMGVKRVSVDGALQRVIDGSLTLPCGPHIIKLPKHAPVHVTVPCGGSTTL